VFIDRIGINYDGKEGKDWNKKWCQ